MRKKIQSQMPLMQGALCHPRAAELEAISKLLDSAPKILDLIHADLVVKGVSEDVGRDAMPAEQVLRAVVLKQMYGVSYEALAFQLMDSSSAQRFCRIGAADRVPKKSCLNQNIKRLRPETMEAVNRVLLGEAARKAIEKGEKVRVDCTVTETNIHEPSDSWLLWDSVRVLIRLTKRAKEALGEALAFPVSDHTRRAKRRFVAIENASSAKKRKPLYQDLLKVTRKTVGQAERVVQAVKALDASSPMRGPELQKELEHYIGLARRVIDQTRRRVIQGEAVPAAEKVVSIFEEHTDIIVKSRRGTEFGHKLCLTTGASSLVLDCVVEDGNPADSTLATQMIERQKEIYGRVPCQAAMDGGFASRANVREIKQMGVTDIAFHKKRGLEVDEMTTDSKTYKQLRRFRAGIEGNISFLKRCFGLGRCLWRGFQSFKAYVWSSVVAVNLLILARRTLA